MFDHVTDAVTRSFVAILFALDYFYLDVAHQTIVRVHNYLKTIVLQNRIIGQPLREGEGYYGWYFQVNVLERILF